MNKHHQVQLRVFIGYFFIYFRLLFFLNLAMVYIFDYSRSNLFFVDPIYPIQILLFQDISLILCEIPVYIA